MSNDDQGVSKRSNRDVYPLTWTVEGVLGDIEGKTIVFDIKNMQDKVPNRFVDLVAEAIEYIGEMEHDPSLRGEYEDVRMNAVAGIICDFVRYVNITAASKK